MIEISTNLIKEAVYKLCFEANTSLDNRVYSKVLKAYNETNDYKINNLLKNILINAKISFETKHPLCQDTGQVIVFLEIGQNIHLTGEYIETAINSAISECYKDNFFRKSIVRNAVFQRINTDENTPAIIYTKITEQDEIKIKVLIKGAGSENKSKLEMMLPSANREEIISAIGEMVLKAGENSCPPMFIGIGIGSSADMAVFMSKKALITEEFTLEEKNLAEEIRKYINSKSPQKYGNYYVLDVKLLTASTHIASMPIALTLNCHSDRFSSATIVDNKIIYEHKKADFIDLNENSNDNKKEILSDDIKTLRDLKENDEFLLTGEIYVARDMAHKKLAELIKENHNLPIEIKDKIIFYAGPCPNKPNEISNSIGPTTAGRMDKYAAELYNLGLLGSIGKGDRNDKIISAIKTNHAKYFTIQGGIAALLAEKIKSIEVVAFPEFGTEAIYKIYVEKFPLTTAIA